MKEKIIQLSFDNELDIIRLIEKSIKNKDEILPFKLKPTSKNYNNFYKIEIFPVLFDEDPAFGYYLDDRLIGFAACSTKVCKFYDLETPTALGVIDLVDPDFRRQGISSKLRVSILKELKSRDFKRVVLDILNSNIASFNCSAKIAKEHSIDSNIVSRKISYDI